VRINIIGAGPAGLLFALLIKRRFPAWRVRVFEQNPPDATFGFGVVFSLNALAFLERDVPDFHEQLVSRLESWPMQRIVHRDEQVDIDGNGFSAIGRLELNRFVQELCVSAGVEIEYHRAIQALDEVNECDLLVGADGEGHDVVGTRLHTDGSGADLIQIPAGGTMLPYARMERPQDAYFMMRGKDVQDFVLEQGTNVVNELLAAHGVDRRDVAFVVPHQANIGVLQGLAGRLEIDFSKFVVTLDRYGNTAAASVLIAFDDLLASKRVARGDLVVLVVFGGGLSWAATLIRI